MADLVYMGKTAWQNLLSAIKTKAGIQSTLTAAQAKDAVDGIKAAVEITDASFLFAYNTRINQYDDIFELISESASKFESYAQSYSGSRKVFDLSKCTRANEYNFRSAFQGASQAGEVILPKTEKEYNLFMTFYNAINIETLDLSHITANNVRQMCSGCSFLEDLDLSGFTITSEAQTMQETFAGLQRLQTIDVSSIDTSNVTYFANTFYNDRVLTEIDLSNWTIGATATTTRMFGQDPALTKVTLGANTAAWGYGATSASYSPFYQSPNIKILRVKATTPPALPGTFALMSSNGVCPLEHIYVPAAAVADYKAATNWSFYEDIIEADPEE